jgi:hypothetical protein
MFGLSQLLLNNAKPGEGGAKKCQYFYFHYTLWKKKESQKCSGIQFATYLGI